MIVLVCIDWLVDLLPFRLYGRRFSLRAQLKQLPPLSSVVSDSIGWVNDDVILLSLSLSAVLKRCLKSIKTPHIFHAMQLNCVPKVEASSNFLQSTRVFISSLDSFGENEPQKLAQSKSRSLQHSPAPGRDKVETILQHPDIQHKTSFALRSFDVLQWLELMEAQLEATCSMETADLPNLLLIPEESMRPSQRRWSAKDKWKSRMQNGTQSRSRSSLMPEDIEAIRNMKVTKKFELKHENMDDKASFDPLQLIFQNSILRNKEQALASSGYTDKVIYWRHRHISSHAVHQVQECLRAEAALAAARAKKENPAKIASMQDEVFRLQRDVDVLKRARELMESRKEAEAASNARAKKAADAERTRSLRVLNTQNSLRQSWQQFIGETISTQFSSNLPIALPLIFCVESLVSSCAFSVASLDHAANKSSSLRTFEKDVKELLLAR